MIDILFAAHITQLEARLRNTRDWRHDPLRISRFRLGILAVVLGALVAGFIASTYPDPAIGEKIIARVGSASPQPSN